MLNLNLSHPEAERADYAAALEAACGAPPVSLIHPSYLKGCLTSAIEYGQEWIASPDPFLPWRIRVELVDWQTFEVLFQHFL